MDANSASFVAALQAASKPNYLGSIAVVDSILRNLAVQILNRREKMSKEDAAEANAKDCDRLAVAFLGEDPAYAPMPVWNSEGHIDQFVAAALGWSGRTPQQIMRGLFTEFVGDFNRLADYANTPGVPEDNWIWQSDALLESYIGFLLGIPPVEN